jgi:hypothetical protein
MGVGARVLAGVVLGVGATVALGSFLYLRKTEEVVERTLTPVTVSAPDLFPADTRLFVALHGLDQDYATFDTWWKRIEPTVAWRSLSGLWGPQGPMSRQTAPLFRQFDDAMTEAEARLGHRPTTEAFFHVYGRFTAFGLVPAPDGGKPGLLGVVKLPDDGAASMLEGHLGKHGKVKRRDGLVHGYPVFEEEVIEGTSMLYGVGGGHLFLADALPALETALSRMAALQAKSRGEAAPAAVLGPSLATEASFRAAAGDRWEDVRAAWFLRKDAEFRLLHPALATLDDFARGSFLHAPDANSMAVAIHRPVGKSVPEIRSSIPTAGGTLGAWEKRVPADVVSAYLVRKVPASERGPAATVDWNAFRGKAIWKEASDLLRSPERLALLVREVAGEEALPKDDTLERLGRDVDLVAAIVDAMQEADEATSVPAFAMVQKGYPGMQGLQSAFGGEAGITTTLMMTSVMEGLREQVNRMVKPGIVTFERRGSALLWSFDLAGAMRDSIGEDAPDAMFDLWRTASPSMVLADGCMWFCMGGELAREIADAPSGGVPLLEADPLWKTCVAELPPNPTVVNYSRPGVQMRISWDAMQPIFDFAMDNVQGNDDIRQVFRGVLAGASRIVRWTEEQKATVWAEYSDREEYGRGLTLLRDPSDGDATPSTIASPITPAVPSMLPDSTFFYAASSVAMRPLYEDFLDGALGAVTDGKRRWATFRNKLGTERPEAARYLDAVEVLLRESKGEAGLALVAPFGAAAEAAPPEMQAMLDRLPSLCVFATYEDGERAFEAATGQLEILRDVMDKEMGDFEDRLNRWREFEGDHPVGVSFFRDRDGLRPAGVLRVLIPPDRRSPVVTFEIGIVRAGNTIFWCTGQNLIKFLRNPVTTGNLAEALARDAKAPLPAVIALTAWRSDAIADCLHPFFGILPMIGPGISLGGYGPEVPEDRAIAHDAGWRKVAELIEDALRPGHWSLSWSERSGSKIHSRGRRFPASAR